MIRRKRRTDGVDPAEAERVLRLEGGCVAPRLGGSALDCWGRDRIEHVKVEQRMGKRGELLTVLCQGHTEDGMRAGFVWATNAENRRKMRDHIIERDADPDVQVDPYPASLL